MTDLQIFFAGVVISGLTVAFVAISLYELNATAREVQKQRRNRFKDNGDAPM